jgi:putative ABC transport system substrate-binding protein
VSAGTSEKIGPAFAGVSRAHAQALHVIEDAFFVTHRMRILKLASKARLATIYGHRAFVDEGGLMSYGPNFGDLYRRAAGYVDTH